MDTLRKKVFHLVIIAVLLLLSCSCTPEMKKTRALQQGESHFKAGDYDAAKIEYLKVLKLDAGNAVAYARCGAMWAAEGARSEERRVGKECRSGGGSDDY